MAETTSNLLIKIRTLLEGFESFKKAADGIRDVSSAAQGAGQAGQTGAAGVNAMGKAAQTAQSQNAELSNGINKLNEQFHSATSALKGLLATYVAFIGIEKIKDMADTAARTETLGVTLGVVARNAGYSKDQIAEYEQNLISLGITTQAAREGLTSLIQAGIDLSKINEDGSTVATKLARASQDLAVITGKNSSETFQRLVTNIQQLDVMGLRYQGIIVDRDLAEEKFAQTIGKTASSLTKQQQQMALMNEVLVKANGLAGSYVESMETVGKKVQSLVRFQQEMNNAVGEKLIPAYGKIVDITTELLKNITEIAKETDESGQMSRKFADIVGRAVQSMADLVENIFQAMADLSPQLLLVAGVIGDMVKAAFDLASEFVDWGVESGVFADVIQTIGLAFAGFQTAVQAVSGALAFLVGVGREWYGTMIKGAGQLIGIFNKDLGESFVSMGEAMQAASADSFAFAAGVKKDLEEGRTALDRYKKSVKDMADESAKALKEVSFEYRDAEESVRALIEAQRQGENTDDLIRQYKKLSDEIIELGKDSDITAEQVKTLLGRLGAVPAKIEEDLQNALKRLKLTMDELTTGVDKGFKDMAGGLEDLIAQLANTNDKVLSAGDIWRTAFQQISAGAKSLQDVAMAADVAGKAMDEGRITEKAYTEEMVTLAKTADTLAASQIDAATSTLQLNVAERASKDLFDEGVISLRQYEIAMDRVRVRQAELNEEARKFDIVAPLKAMGKTIQEVETDVSKSTRKMLEALGDVAGGANLAGDSFFRLFNDSVGEAKTLGGLLLLKEALNEAAASGQLAGDRLTSAFGKVALQFDTVFDTRLKAANTHADFEVLIADAAKLAGEGVISAEKLNQVFVKVYEAMSGVVERNKQITENIKASADAALAFSKAQDTADRSQIDVGKSRRELETAVTKARKEGTDASKADVVVAQAQLALSEQKAKLDQSKAQEAAANAEVVAAKQAAAAAAEELSRDKSNILLQTNVKLANDAVLAAERNVAVTHQNATAEEQVVGQLETAVAKAKELADAVKEGAQNSLQFEKGFQLATVNVGAFKSQIDSLGQLSKKAKEEAIGLVNAFKTTRDKDHDPFNVGGLSAVAYGLQKIEEKYKRIAEQAAALKAQEDAAAQSITDRFNDAKNAAEGLERVHRKLDGSLDPVLEAYRQIRIEAKAVADSALDAAKSFIASAASIHNELLKAQGKELEAAQSEYKQRLIQLRLEEQLLEVKIKSAIATAAAAGVDTGPLQASLKDVQEAYKQSLSDLAALEIIKEEGIKKSMVEREAAERAATNERLNQQALQIMGRANADTSGQAANAGERQATAAERTAQALGQASTSQQELTLSGQELADREMARLRAMEDAQRQQLADQQAVADAYTQQLKDEEQKRKDAQQLVQDKTDAIFAYEQSFRDRAHELELQRIADEADAKKKAMDDYLVFQSHILENAATWGTARTPGWGTAGNTAGGVGGPSGGSGGGVTKGSGVVMPGSGVGMVVNIDAANPSELFNEANIRRYFAPVYNQISARSA